MKKLHNKFTIKKLLKKPKGVKTYAYQMLLSSKTSVTYNSFLTSRQTTVSVVKQPSLAITQVFAGHYPMSHANIQAWCNNGTSIELP